LEAGSGGNGEGSRTVLQEKDVSGAEAVMLDELQKTPIIPLVRKSSRHIREPDRFQEMLNFILWGLVIWRKALFKKYFDLLFLMLAMKGCLFYVFALKSST